MPRFVKPQFGEKERAAAEKCGSPEYQISFAEFSAKAENKTKIMFGRGGSPGWIQNSRYFAIMVLNSSWAEGGV